LHLILSSESAFDWWRLVTCRKDQESLFSEFGIQEVEYTSKIGRVFDSSRYPKRITVHFGSLPRDSQNKIKRNGRCTGTGSAKP
jgi:hypothetical protein